MRITVECYSGYKGSERPLRFRAEGKEYIVKEIAGQWRGPDGMFFRVKANDGNLYILRLEMTTGAETWTLESVSLWEGKRRPVSGVYT